MARDLSGNGDAIALMVAIHESELVRFDPESGMTWAWPGGDSPEITMFDIWGEAEETRTMIEDAFYEVATPGSMAIRLRLARHYMQVWESEITGVPYDEIKNRGSNLP